MQIFKQKLQKIRRDLAKLNKKYDVKTRKQHYKSKVLKAGTGEEAMDSWEKMRIEMLNKVSDTIPGEAAATAREFRDSYGKSSNPKYLSKLMALFKQFIELIAQLFKRKSTKPEEAEAEEEEEEAEEAAHGKAHERAKDPRVREALRRREKLAAAEGTTAENAALAEGNLGLAEELLRTWGVKA